MPVQPLLPPDVLGAQVRPGPVRVRDRRDLGVVGPASDVVTVRADRTTAMVEVHGVARYLVEAGREVTVDAQPAVPVERVRTWLHGTVAAFVAAHQGCFALHASVVDVEGRRIAVAGDSGAGKSTTVLALAGRGGVLVSDDVAVFDATPDALVNVPFGRRTHVERGTADALGIDQPGAPAVAPGSPKIALPAPDAQPGVVHGVVVLRRAAVANTQSRLVEGLEAVRTVRRHTFRRAYLEGLYREEMFAWQVAVADRAPVHRLVRPEGWTVDAVADEVRAIARGIGAPTGARR